jgi:methionyl-tRNA formyltransferase
MMDELAPRLAAGERPARPQQHERATWLAHRRPEDGLIAWDQPAEAIWRQVRAVSRPYPGAFTPVDEGVMKIWRARTADFPEWHAQVGQIFHSIDGCPVVRCGDGRDLVIEDYEMLNAKKPVGQKRLGRL